MEPKKKFDQDMVGVFDKIFEDFNLWSDFGFWRPTYSCASFPPTDIYLKENKDLVFEFAVAGYSEDGVNLDFQGDYMTMKIEKTKKEKEVGKEKVHYLRQGIKHSKVEERYYVPSSKYNRNEAKAELKNGLLRVVIPAKEEAKPKPLKINIG